LFEKPEGLDLIKVRRPEFFQTRSLTSLADDVAKGLAGAAPPLRQQFVKPYQDYLKNNQRVSTAQREIMNGSIKTILEFNQSTGEVLTGNPVAIRSLVHGTALGLLDAQADTLIENNRFIGRVSLYGDEEWFGNAEWNSFLSDLRAGKFQLTSPAAALQMRSNSLTGIRVDRRILKAMQAANGQLRNLFGRALLTDNWCFNETYQLLANQLTIGSNQFNYGQDFRSNVNVGALLLITPVAAVVGGRSVVIVGNSAPNPSSRLLYAVPPPTVTSINSAQLAANFLDVKPL
jgi:hypothetical protein